MTSWVPTKDMSLLHISDLHIKRKHAANHKIKFPMWDRLWEEAADSESISAQCDVCIISGDIAASSPDEKVYRSLKADLDRRFPAENELPKWLVIPGNHDRRRWGNVGLDRGTFDRVFKDWEKVWWDIDHPLIVIPIDSNPGDGERENLTFALPLARGRVADVELARIPAALTSVRKEATRKFSERLKMIPRNEMRDFMVAVSSAFDPADMTSAAIERCDDVQFATMRERLARILGNSYMARAVRTVVLHHHPVGIADTENLGLTNQDVYLALSNSGDFVRTCRENRVSLVLHGHKHAPHRMVLGLPGSDVEQLGVVGSGSTTLRKQLANPCGNLIKISRAGETSVSMLTLTNERWAQSDKLLVVRPWERVRSHLGHAAAEETLVSADYLNVYVQVLSDGDAIVTNEYYGLKWTEDAIVDGHIKIPVRVFGGGNGSVQCKRRVLDAQEEHLFGPATYVPSPDNSMVSGVFDGWISIAVPKSSSSGLQITARVTTFAMFAMNAWHVAASLGPNDTEDGYSIGCTLSIKKQLTLALSCQGRPIFNHVKASCKDLDGSDLAPEQRAMRVYSVPTRDGVHMQVDQPVWGATYGLRWTPVRDKTDEVSSVAKTWSSRRKSIDSILRDAPREVDTCVYEIRDSKQGDRALVVPAAAGRTLPSQLASLPIGSGIAGRSAWLRDAVFWARKMHDEKTSELTDFYVSVAGSKHEAIAALPLTSAKSDLFGVLSVSARQPGVFAAGVRETLTSNPRKLAPDLAWLGKMRQEIEKILRV